MSISMPAWTLGTLIAVAVLLTAIILAILVAVGVLSALPVMVELGLFGALALSRLT